MPRPLKSRRLGVVVLGSLLSGTLLTGTLLGPTLAQTLPAPPPLPDSVKLTAPTNQPIPTQPAPTQPVSSPPATGSTPDSPILDSTTPDGTNEPGHASPEASQSEATQSDTTQSDTTPSDTTETTATPEASEVSIELTRTDKDGKKRRIKIVRGGSDESAYSATCLPQDNEPEDAPSTLIYANQQAPGVQVSLDKNQITAPLAVITKKQGGDGHIEMSAGTAGDMAQLPDKPATRLESCGVTVSPQTTPNTVLVTQGKTSLKGQKLVYDETDGVARIDGPITFQRDNAKDPLSGTSDTIEVNVDTEKTVLVGHVVLSSEGGRISKAGRVEYDDTLSQARLYATPEQPAESVQGKDVLRLTSGSILYNLSTNGVRVSAEKDGNITGEFQDGDAGQGSQESVSSPAAPASQNPANN